jgi:hypothetical protein
MRVQSDQQAKNGAWIHRLDQPLAKEFLPEPKKRPPPPDFERLLAAFKARTSIGQLERHARNLGVSSGCLKSMQCCDYNGNLAFPMWLKGRCVGIQYRATTGKKWSEIGSHHGLFQPTEKGALAGKMLVVVEGASDTAAMLSAGVACVGRPSCLGLEKPIAELGRGRLVVIVADRDQDKTRPDGTLWNPGREGAIRLGQACLKTAWKVKVLMPPGCKDVRAWFSRSINRLTRDRFLEAVEAADVFEGEL